MTVASESVRERKMPYIYLVEEAPNRFQEVSRMGVLSPTMLGIIAYRLGMYDALRNSRSSKSQDFW